MPDISNEKAMRLFWQDAEKRGMSFSSEDVADMCRCGLPEGKDELLAYDAGDVWLFGCKRIHAKGARKSFLTAVAPRDLCDFDSGSVYAREEVYAVPGLFVPSMSGGVQAAMAETRRIAKLLKKGSMMPGQPMQAAAKGKSCLGRCVTVTPEGLCATFTVATKTGDELHNANDWRAEGGYVTAVPDDACDGWAACVMRKNTKTGDYWGAGRMLSVHQAKVAGWRRAASGNLMTPKTGPWRPHAPGSEGEREALAKGFLPALDATEEEIRCRAAVDVCDGAVEPSTAFLDWFRKEHAARRHALWQHAMAYEKAVIEFSL